MDILIQQELALMQPEFRKNKAAVLNLLHQDFKEVGKSGRSFNLNSIIQLMENEEASHGIALAQEFNSVELAANCQLLTYKTAWQDNQGKLSEFAKRCSIWVNSGEQWQLKYHQGTPCPPFEIIS